MAGQRGGGRWSATSRTEGGFMTGREGTGKGGSW